MTDLDKQLEGAFPMDTSAGPGQIMRALAKIEDDLALNQDKYRDLIGRKKRLDKFMDTFEATLIMLASGATITEKKVAGKAKLHDTKEYQDYLIIVGDIAKVEHDFEYLDIRRSIGQSILKALDKDEAKFGKEAGHGSFTS